MAKPYGYIPNFIVEINGAKLRELIKKSNLSAGKCSVDIGMAPSSLYKSLDHSRIRTNSLEKLCQLLGVNTEEYLADYKEPETVTAEVTPAVTWTTTSVDYTDVLTRIAVALEKMADQPKPNPRLSEIERCCLLLKQMTCYGICQEADFIAKAEAYGMGVETRDAAMKMLGVKIDNKSNVSWLRRGGSGR